MDIEKEVKQLKRTQIELTDAVNVLAVVIQEVAKKPSDAKWEALDSIIEKVKGRVNK